MFHTAQILLIVFLFTSFKNVQQVSSINGPKKMEGYIGKNVTFMWNTTDQGEILWVSWGIKNGNIANPQFINVNGYTGRVSINIDLDETLRKRVGFVGDLKKGRAWFVLKNLTVNDTNEYIASISYDATSDLPYYVRLNVKEEKATTTREPKGLKGEQAVTSPQTRMVQTSKKETKTESDASKDTKKPLSSNGNLQLQDAIIALCVLAPLLL